MTNTATETLRVVVEREMPFPPEKIWRALTQPHLIEAWLMKNDFKPVVDHRFNLRYEHGDSPAHGAVGLPAGSAAGLPGRQVRVAEILCKPGADLAADRLKSAGTQDRETAE
jgi:hypothetical protein